MDISSTLLIVSYFVYLNFNIMDDLVISMHENAVNEALKNAYKVFQAKLMGDIKKNEYTLHWEVYQFPEVKFDIHSVNKARNYYSRAMELPHHNKFLL